MLLKFAKRTASFGGRRLLSSHAASGMQRVPFRARLNGAAAGSVGAAAAGLSMSMYASLHSTPASSECCPGGGAAPEKGKGNHSGVEHYQLRQDIIDTVRWLVERAYSCTLQRLSLSRAFTLHKLINSLFTFLISVSK